MLYLLADRDLCLACFHGYRCVIRQPRRYVHRQQSTARYSAAGSSPCSSWHVNVTPSPDRLDAVKSPAGTSGSSAVRKRSCCNTRSAPQQATHRSTGFNKWESTDPTSSASLADDAASGLPTLQYLVEAHRSLRHPRLASGRGIPDAVLEWLRLADASHMRLHSDAISNKTRSILRFAHVSFNGATTEMAKI